MGLGASSISDVIKKGMDKNLSHYNFQTKDKFLNKSNEIVMILSNNNLLDKYYYELIKHIDEVVLTDKEMEKYRFKPDLFCLDYYGTVELWGALLRFNNILSRSEFDKKKLKVFKLSFIDTILDILLIEGDFIDENLAYIEK